MPTEITESTIDDIVRTVVATISLEHSKTLAVNILTYFKAGSDDIHKSALTRQQISAIDSLTAKQFGYLGEFNTAVGEQINDKAKNILSSGGGYEEIKKTLVPYVEDVFSGKEQVIIDNVGKMRTELRLDKYGKLYKTEKEITRKYVTTTNAYADMLSRTAAHSAWEMGRASQYQKSGIDAWIFEGPSDERARPWHVALIGTRFVYGTEQSNYALELLQEPNCRHRQVPSLGDGLDSPQSVYDRIKEKAGVKWSDEAGDWVMK